ncbi:MAG: DUF4091 domain-containing protein [Rhodopirellula sp.]|nr:DUF4091 domain-containing protein [Rhodopirellula sp.]
MKVLLRMMLTSTLVLAAVAEVAADWHVWTVAQTRRVLREDPAAEGLAVRLGAAKNEWESFQVLMRGDAPIKGITLQPGDLTGPDGAVIPASDARLYRQHQLEITVPTHRNEQFKPGWYPDPLIPFRHPISGEPLCGARFTAVPFDLPAAQTHGFWVDVKAPADAKAGVYRGQYRLTADGGTTVEIPVELSVWDFALPDTPSLRTALGSPADRLRGYYARRAKEGKEKEPEDWDAVESQVAELLSRHDINATPPRDMIAPEAQPDGTYRIPAEQIDAFREFVDRYHINAFVVPHPRTAVKDPVAEQEKLRRWLGAWDRAAKELDRPQVLFYTYLRDEPNDEEAYRYVQKWGRAVREANSVVKVMVVEQTWTQDEAWGDLYGAVDIWCPLFSLFKADSAAKRQALGETVWTYTALCQRDPTPWWHTDFPLLNYRVPAWLAWRYRMRGILYWGGMAYWNDVEDPWTEPGTLDRRDRNPKLMYNGEGSMLYPGRAVGYEGVAPGLRVKALRDAIEDYAYLSILEEKGLAEKAEKAVLPLTKSWFDWETDPAAYDRARVELAKLILAGK